MSGSIDQPAYLKGWNDCLILHGLNRKSQGANAAQAEIEIRARIADEIAVLKACAESEATARAEAEAERDALAAAVSKADLHNVRLAREVAALRDQLAAVEKVLVDWEALPQSTLARAAVSLRRALAAARPVPPVQEQTR